MFFRGGVPFLSHALFAFGQAIQGDGEGFTFVLVFDVKGDGLLVRGDPGPKILQCAVGVTQQAQRRGAFLEARLRRLPMASCPLCTGKNFVALLAQEMDARALEGAPASALAIARGDSLLFRLPAKGEQFVPATGKFEKDVEGAGDL